MEEEEIYKRGLTEKNWRVILGAIEDRRCTPFLGAGVNYGILPLGAQIANEWANADAYPMTSRDDLSGVAQFLAIKYKSGTYPKRQMLKRLRLEAQPDFSHVGDNRLACLRTLANLPLPVYLTTNYDDLLGNALRTATPRKNPRREFCKWHDGLKHIASAFDANYEPDELNPLIYHLHGSDQDLRSMVLTEDDYLDFLVNVSKDPKILPPRIQEALTNASLLFIGYRLKDINFRVIHRGLVESMDRSQRELSVTVQMAPPDGHSGNPVIAQEFLSDYFRELNVCVYWGTAGEFAHDLRYLWEKHLA